jgi:16S rRNA (uracil1498-N3)-methyltransferase
VALHFVTADAAAARVGDEVVLTGPEAHHAASVRRVRVGEEVTLGDGAGVWLDGVCDIVSPREVVVRITARAEHPASSPSLVLAQALAKGDRDELAVQASTELGVSAVIPWQAERSVSRWDGKEAKGIARWTSIVREAAKQAHRSWIPEVRPVLRTAALTALAPETRMLVLEPTATVRLSDLDLAGERREIVLVVGPEGGIAPAERRALADAGAQEVRLGPEVLRTSTAGAAALTVLNLRLGRW